MKNFSFKVYVDNRGNEYSHAFICLGIHKERSPHLSEDDKLHLVDKGEIGLSFCDECLNNRRLKKYPR
jgi:hypothetical protein